METKKVMPEDIDYGLVERIYKGIENDVPTSSLYREDIQTIRATLAYLANNPIEPTEEQVNSLWEMPWKLVRTITNKEQNLCVNFQRIAYLKKEEELPQLL